MADNVVTFLLENLTELLSREANLFVGAEDQVRLLHNELRLINIFLKNSEEKRNEHDIVKEVVSQIRDVALEAEDVIDTFITHVTKQRRRGRLEKLLHPFDHLTMLHSVAKKIESIKNVIKEIYENRDKYGIDGTESSGSGRDAEAVESLHRRRRNVEEQDVVGFFHDIEELVKQLVEGDSRLDAISIIGMGGLGKTTLAKKIYNNNRVKNYFDCRAWVYVSQEYTTKKLLFGILRCLMPITKEIYSMSDDLLKEKLLKFLKDKKYLIVMDDVWKNDVWNEVSDAFPNESNGSRILITSRIKEIGLHASSTTCPYSLPFLNKNESWELFSKKVFRGGTCPPDLETLGKKIVESCHGLPLSIVVLGGLLANKEKTHRIWSKLIGNVNWYLTDTDCAKILALSYYHLPRRLKPCFLYFGLYPEDFTISAKQLIQLWVAEGFIQHSGNINVEDVAEDYLEELIDRSLIQVTLKRTDGGVKTVRIHDLLRDLCISESAKEKFLEVHSNVDNAVMRQSRRLAIHYDTPQYISLNPRVTSNFRSFLCFGEDTHRFDPNHWKWLLKNFELVRVVDLRYVNLKSIPNKIENLILLRYLKIGWNKLRVIPDSICNLSNLETLDLRDSPIKSLPREIWKLQKLRNLYLFGPTTLPEPWGREEGKALWNLQVVSGIVPNEETRNLILNAGFPNVKKLRLCCATPNDGKGKEQEVLENLRHLHHLQILKIIEHCQLPNSFPSTLTKITLVRVYLRSNTVVMLGSLPNLRILKLREHPLGYSTYDLDYNAGGFPELQVLQMVNLKTKMWELESGAMPKLQQLIIKNCTELKMLPSELWSLKALQKVEIIQPSRELRMMLERLKMKDGCKLIVSRNDDQIFERFIPPGPPRRVHATNRLPACLESCYIGGFDFEGP